MERSWSVLLFTKETITAAAPGRWQPAAALILWSSRKFKVRTERKLGFGSLTAGSA